MVFGITDFVLSVFAIALLVTHPVGKAFRIAPQISHTSVALQILFPTPRFPTRMSSLSQADVFDLVIEYLANKGFTETEQALKHELQRSKSSPAKNGTSAGAQKGSRLEDLLEKSYVTQMASGDAFPRKKMRTHLDSENSARVVEPESRPLSFETRIIAYNPCEKDPYGASSMPIYQTSTFAQPGADQFGDYDYTRSGNPTRDALQKQIADMEGVAGARAFCFTTGMAALSAVVRVVAAGEEVIVNDDSYGGTYRLMSKVASRQGIRVRYINMAGKDGPAALAQAINPSTKLVMIESPTNPMQRICNIRELARVCHANKHPTGTLLSIDNTMMSPVLSRPLELGADIVVHSATKFMCGHSDTMAGAVIVKDMKEGDKSLADTIYFYQNAEGTALAPFDCWLVSRGIKTMALRVQRQQANALQVARWLKTVPLITTVFYAGLEDHRDYDIHIEQASGGGSVVCFLTGNVELSKHIVTHTKLFKITVSFGSVTSLISLPGNMSHASIPAEVKAAREFPEDLVRMSIGIESPEDLIADLQRAMATFGKV
jgi:cysteine-S-conjugate beta-lyase